MPIYSVTFRESAIITEEVEATSKAEAIRLVKDGLGVRVGFEMDETRYPTSHKATPHDDESTGR